MPLVAPLLAVLLAAEAGPWRSNAVEVVASGGRITVRAERLPLHQLLDRIATATGMTVTYEGSRPTAPITFDVENLTEIDAILRLMEGLGISYVLRTDQTGEGVDLLIITGAGAGPLLASVTPSQHVDPPFEEPVPAYNHVPLDPAVLEAAGGEKPADLNNPYMGLPPQHFPQAVGGVPPQTTEEKHALERQLGVPDQQRDVPAPQFPQGASYPYR
jgi:hypothetical protein